MKVTFGGLSKGMIMVSPTHSPGIPAAARCAGSLLGLCAVLVAQPPTPRIDYATYLGGIYYDSAVAVAIDSSGSAYVAGNTNSPDFPLTSTAFGEPDVDSPCAFLTKLNPTGTAIDFSICFAKASAGALGLDAKGSIYWLLNNVGAGGFASSSSGSAVVKLDPTASTILYNLAVAALPAAIAVDGAGNAYLTGSADSGLPATVGAYQPEVAPGDSCPAAAPNPSPTMPCPDAFVMKLSPAGSLIYSTYLGGSGYDAGNSVAFDRAGNVWIAGETASPNFPITANALSNAFGGEFTAGLEVFGDGFVAELDPTGGKRLYSTYLGGNQPDAASGIAVDGGGAAYVVGYTQSADFPVTQGALQTTYGTPCLNCQDGFVAKFSASGTLVYSTYLTGAASAVAVDSLGQAYVNAAQTPPVLVLTPGGSSVAATSPIGGSQLVLDGKGGLYTAGLTTTQIFLSTLHAQQTEYGGGGADAFAAKVDFTQPPLPAVTSLVNAASLIEGNAAYHLQDGEVAPGEVVTLFGAGFGSQPTVSFNTNDAPILFADDTQINAVVPFGVSEPLVLTVMAGNQTIAIEKLPLVKAVPAIFTINGSGAGQGAILNQDGTVNSASNPAARGSVISLWMTGAGNMSTIVLSGSIGPLSPPFPTPALDVSAWINEIQASLTFAGQAPGLVAGIIQVNLQIPLNSTTGSAVPIWVDVGDFVGPPVTLAIN